jgi:metal transporter CNNM
LLGCAITNSAISILLAEAEGNLSGFFISTSITLIFGEMLPLAICARYGLQVGSYTQFILYFFYYSLFIVSFPVATVIGRILGDDEGYFLSKSRIKKMFDIYEK